MLSFTRLQFAHGVRDVASTNDCIRTWQQAAHHDAHRKRVPAPLLPTCAAQRVRPHPPLRLSRQRSPGCSHRPRSPAARLQYSATAACRVRTSHIALPTLRRQHEHRAQPHCATTGISMQASGFFMTLSPPNGTRRCDGTSWHTCAFSANLRTHQLFLLACSSRNRSFLRGLSAFPTFPAQLSQPLSRIHAGQIPPLAP